MGDSREELAKSYFFKLLRGTFHLLGSTFSDLKGGRGNIFCAFGIVEILVFSSVASPQRQGSQLVCGGAVESLKKYSIGLYQAWFPYMRFPAGRKINNLVGSSAPSKYPICVIHKESGEEPSWQCDGNRLSTQFAYSP